jgi:hypothetical protein
VNDAEDAYIDWGVTVGSAPTWRSPLYSSPSFLQRPAPASIHTLLSGTWLRMSFRLAPLADSDIGGAEGTRPPPDPLVANSGHGGRPGASEHGSECSKAREPCQSHWRCCTSLLYFAAVLLDRELSSPTCRVRAAGASPRPRPHAGVPSIHAPAAHALCGFGIRGRLCPSSGCA